MSILARFTAAVVLPGTLTLFSMTGCEQEDLGVLDNRTSPPAVSQPSFSPREANIDTIPPSGGMYPIRIIARVRATDPSGQANLERVSAMATRPGSSSPFVETALRDDGNTPDVTAGDGIFSGTLEFTATRPQAGRYTISFLAGNLQGAVSSVLQESFFLARNNSRPVLTSVVAPDTVALPATGSIVFRMTAAAADSDGLGDIREVYFRSLDSSDPSQKFFLRDDGGTSLPSSGDDLQGDGIFSILVRLDATNQRGTFRFLFQAADSFADTSGSVLHLLTVR